MSRFCPICECESPKFKEFGYNPRKDAMCPNCNSLERQRLTWLYITRMHNFLIDVEKKLMLHIAPEKTFVNKFRSLLNAGYITADISGENVMVKMDITNIIYPNNYFDYILCIHVLEHIIDDRKAIQELYRVLNPNGWAIILVPIESKGLTYENMSITDPNERLKIFGHPEHVRNYGTDYINRLTEPGFNVNIIEASDFLSEDEIINMGITQAAGQLYFCTK